MGEELSAACGPGSREPHDAKSPQYHTAKRTTKNGKYGVITILPTVIPISLPPNGIGRIVVLVPGAFHRQYDRPSLS